MRSNEIQSALLKLWSSGLEKIDMDIHGLQLSIDLITGSPKDMAKTPHRVVFEGVSAFFFSNGEGEDRFTTEKRNWVEMTELDYYGRDRGDQMHLSYYFDKPNTPGYSANPNFYLEMWGSILVVEAKEVIIDGIRYTAT